MLYNINKKIQEKRTHTPLNLTENDSRTMSSSPFTAHKNPQKILGKKNPQ
jgi:hypothetical protein